MTLLTGSHAHPRADAAAFLQILDIETPELFEAFTEELHFLGHSAILYRCVLERTASDAGHIGFRCRTIGPTQKLTLARRADKKILIELLQHQPCTVAPTAIRCKPEHPEGGRYTLVQGHWEHLQEISAEQRQVLLDLARSFNELPEKIATEKHGRSSNGTRPGDLLNERADLGWWQDLLSRHDWREVSRPGLASRGVYYFQRPGKVGRAPSATYGKTGACLYVFSSNAHPFEPDTAYSPFAAYTLLEHDGNFTAAATALATLYRTATAQAAEHDAYQRHNGHPPPTTQGSDSTVIDTADEDGRLPYSDYTNARAFVREHGQKLRYCYPWKSWLVWTGTHWQRDTSGTVMLWAKDTIKRLARRVETLEDDKKIAALMAHIKSSLSTAKLKALVESAQSELGIPVQPDELDRDPWLLNCANGTLDLRTGKLRPHCRDDLLTKSLAIAYDPTANCPTWDRFLWRIMGGR